MADAELEHDQSLGVVGGGEEPLEMVECLVVRAVRNFFNRLMCEYVVDSVVPSNAEHVKDRTFIATADFERVVDAQWTQAVVERPHEQRLLSAQKHEETREHDVNLGQYWYLLLSGRTPP